MLAMNVVVAVFAFMGVFLMWLGRRMRQQCVAEDRLLNSIRELQRGWEVERIERIARLARHMAWLPENPTRARLWIPPEKVNWKKEGF